MRPGMPGRRRAAYGDFVQLARAEWPLAVSAVTVAIFVSIGDHLDSLLRVPLSLIVAFAWLFAIALWSCLRVVRHADRVAEVTGQPYGTLVLTLSITTVEVVSISAIMLHGQNNPTLVRDTLFSVVMIFLGGMAGLSLLLGGWRYKEQVYNLYGANAYLGVLLPLCVLTLTLPNFTHSTAGPTLSFAQQIFLTLVSIGLYCSFLAIQTGRHRGYFSAAAHPKAASALAPSLTRHSLLLVAYVVAVVLLAEELAHPIDYLIETLHMPQELGGVIIAVIVATPEAISAVRSTLANQVQQAVNAFLGSALSTIGLTVPAMLILSGLTGRAVYLGLTDANDVLLLLTLAVSVVTFASGRTNVLQGAVHVVLFGAFLLLIFEN
jgi:Ca2+:H+ antiporter